MLERITCLWLCVRLCICCCCYVFLILVFCLFICLCFLLSFTFCFFGVFWDISLNTFMYLKQEGLVVHLWYYRNVGRIIRRIVLSNILQKNQQPCCTTAVGMLQMSIKLWCQLPNWPLPCAVLAFTRNVSSLRFGDVNLSVYFVQKARAAIWLTSVITFS